MIFHSRTTRTFPFQGCGPLAVALLSMLSVLPCSAQTPAINWQSAAIKVYPDLALSDSNLNRLYVAAYGSLKNSNPSALRSPECYFVLAIIAGDSLKTEPILLGDSMTQRAKTVADKVPEFLRSFAEIERQHAAEVEQMDRDSLKVKATIHQRVSGGALCSISVTQPEEEVREQVSQGQTMLGPGLVTRHTTRRTVYRDNEISDNVFILGVNKKVDGEEWLGQIWPAGEYTYENVMHANKTVRRWSSDRTDAILLLYGNTLH